MQLINRFFSSKFIRVLIIFMFLIIVMDPVFALVIPYGDKHNAYSIWILQNTSIGARIFYSFKYLFPLLFTGGIYQFEVSSSLGTCKTVRLDSRGTYLLYHILVPACLCFLIFFLFFSLNTILSNLLYENKIACLEEWYLPNPDTFAMYILDHWGILMLELFYGFLVSLMETIFCIVIICFQICFRFKNVYLGFVVPVVIIYVLLYVFETKLDMMDKSITLITQPATSHAIKNIIWFDDLLITYGLWSMFIAVLLMIAVKRSKDWI